MGGIPRLRTAVARSRKRSIMAVGSKSSGTLALYPDRLPAPGAGVSARVSTGTLGVLLAVGDAPRPMEESLVKKGRHRRFEEARSLKRSVATVPEPCAECGADPEDEHASWCMAETDELDDTLGDDESPDSEDDPLNE